MAKILIIDDDPTTLGLLHARLEKAGYTVVEARDGEEALKIVKREKPDLIFLDVRIPKLDGWQVCRTLKSDPSTAHRPIVMLTGCSQDAQETYGLQCGADEYVTKPWDAGQLIKLTTRLLQRSTSAHDPRSPVIHQRIKQYVQRVVRLMGNLPKSSSTEMMAAALLRLSTTLLAEYESAAGTPVSGDYRLQISRVEQCAGELLYWLGLLNDSKTTVDTDVRLLVAEGHALREIFLSALKDSKAA